MNRETSVEPLRSRHAARLLRGNQTAAEQRLWSYLRRRQVDGLRFRRQHVLGSLIADFYCPQLRLAVEVDGSVHTRPEQQVLDRERDAALRGAGSQICRVTSEDVFNEISAVLTRIREAARVSRDTPAKTDEAPLPRAAREGTGVGVTCRRPLTG